MKVIIDPGHGGQDPGAIDSSSGLKEKDITLKIGLYTKAFLKKHYVVDVKMTRNKDVFLTLNNRAVIANQFNADLFVSIHVNSHINGTGFESFIYSKTSKETLRFQKVLHSEIQDFYSEYGLKDRGLKLANFYVLKHTKMPAILTENLFIQKDGKLLKSKSFLKSIGEAHAQGIARILELSKKK